MDADGSNQTKISDHLNGSDSPSWSPDGSKIAYINMGWIWVVNADGSGRTNLHTDTTTGFSNSRPLWSPDGAKIAFVSNRDDNDEIYIMNADGSNETNLTNNPDYDKKHTWSPDGSKIAYISTTEDSNGPDNDIYVMNADGSNQTKLADSVDGLNPGSVSAPAWSP
jgi:TolB protein